MEVLQDVRAPPNIETTPEILRLIASIDEFKGEWRATERMGIDHLQSLRRIATIESIGSSTRIEGAKLSDREIEKLLGGLDAESFRTRDEQEVVGYSFVMKTVQEAWQELSITEGILLQMHRDLLRYSTKDERHRGAWKTLANHVVALAPDGEELGVVFETAAPFDTPGRMGQLLEWHAAEERSGALHPLLRIATFVVDFLAIHPFQDGNGRLSRVLTNLLLLRAGYGFVSYGSLESVVERRKKSYYLALRRTQTTLADERPDWEPWVLFFLQSMEMMVGRLRERIEQSQPGSVLGERPGAVYRAGEGAGRSGAVMGLSPLAEEIVELMVGRRSLTVSEALAATGANRNTLKDKFRELVGAGIVTLHGKGRGAHYRPVR